MLNRLIVSPLMTNLSFGQTNLVTGREPGRAMPQTARLARGLDEGPGRGWVIVSMARDWRRIFPATP